jgi:hypothetical protein
VELIYLSQPSPPNPKTWFAGKLGWQGFGLEEVFEELEAVKAVGRAMRLISGYEYLRQFSEDDHKVWKTALVVNWRLEARIVFRQAFKVLFGRPNLSHKRAPEMRVF